MIFFKLEKMNTTKMDKSQVHNIIAARPKRLTWTIFYRALFPVYLLIGSASFIAAATIWGELMASNLLAEWLKEVFGNRGIPPAASELIVNQLLKPLSGWIILLLFVCSLLSFILAYYCRKTLDRIVYIHLLEAAVKEEA